MAVESKQVETREEDYKCDTCNEGHMRPTGMTLTSYPPQYPHICNSCGIAKTFRVTYPRIVHVELTLTGDRLNNSPFGVILPVNPEMFSGLNVT